jgi:hypothetical protein
MYSTDFSNIREMSSNIVFVPEKKVIIKKSKCAKKKVNEIQSIDAEKYLPFEEEINIPLHVSTMKSYPDGDNISKEYENEEFDNIKENVLKQQKEAQCKGVQPSYFKI